MLIVDEIQSGFGRTGRIWSYTKARISPDIFVAGKAVGGGYPVSLLFTVKEIAESLTGGRHGSTFAGNLAAMAAVRAAVDVLFHDGVPKRAERSGRLLSSSLREALELNSVRDIRGEGLMLGVELKYNPTPILKCLQDHGVLALKAGATVVRFLPPYMISGDDIEWVTKSFRECVTKTYGS